MDSAFVFLKGVLILHITKNVLLVNAGGCNTSLATVSPVSRCPRTKEEWTKAVARKNCGDIKHNCGFIQYHCVINTWRNKTIEVCAPSENIVGNVCAEYNIGGARIQRNGNVGGHCDSCPVSYNSTESLKYQECYLVGSSDAPSNKEHLSSNIRGKSHVNTILIFAVCVVICVMLFILLSLKMRSTMWTTLSGIFGEEPPVNENDSLKETLTTEV